MKFGPFTGVSNASVVDTLKPNVRYFQLLEPRRYSV